MPPDFYFALTLIAKMAVTAGFVVAATVAAERAGPLIGGLVATLPLGAGPVYVFLALDHGAPFIAQSAVNSLAINNVNVIFALCYALLAQRNSLTVSLALSLVLWFVLAYGVHVVHWSLLSAGLTNLVVLPTCIALARPLRHVRIPPVRTYWYDLALRALMVATLVGVTVTLSFRIGPGGSGILAVFPDHSHQYHLDFAPARRRQADRRGDGQCGARADRLCLRLRGAAFYRAAARRRHRPFARALNLGGLEPQPC